jgi:hypothetical protein
MWDTFACATANFSTHYIISIAVLENVSPDTGLQKRATFSTLNVGLAGTGNQTRATCVASSGTNQPLSHPLRLPPLKTNVCLHSVSVKPSPTFCNDVNKMTFVNSTHYYF